MGCVEQRAHDEHEIQFVYQNQIIYVKQVSSGEDLTAQLHESQRHESQPHEFLASSVGHPPQLKLQTGTNQVVSNECKNDEGTENPEPNVTQDENNEEFTFEGQSRSIKFKVNEGQSSNPVSSRLANTLTSTPNFSTNLTTETASVNESVSVINDTTDNMKARSSHEFDLSTPVSSVLSVPLPPCPGARTTTNVIISEPVIIEAAPAMIADENYISDGIVEEKHASVCSNSAAKLSENVADDATITVNESKTLDGDVKIDNSIDGENIEGLGNSPLLLNSSEKRNIDDAIVSKFLVQPLFSCYCVL